jgi:hypothetical protein
MTVGVGVCILQVSAMQKQDPRPSIFVKVDVLRRICGGEGTAEAEQRNGVVMELNRDGRGAGKEKKKRKEKQERNQENRKQGEREEGGKREREERGKILRGIIWCFVLILIFCNKLMCQLWSGWQKTWVFCHLRIEVISNW